MQYVIDPPTQVSLPVHGSDERFPVRRIFCVGRNYAEHIREMGNDEKEPPFFFTKPSDAVVESGQDVLYPPQTNDLHHEVELVLVIGTPGADIAPADASRHIWGAAVGIDLTRRDLQAKAKSTGRPWDMAKGFDASAPIAPLVPVGQISSLSTGRIWLGVNGQIRQDADLSDMIWPVEDCIAHLSRSVALAPGDLIMTGTPAGVGPLVVGDKVTGGITGLPEIAIQMVERG